MAIFALAHLLCHPTGLLGQVSPLKFQLEVMQFQDIEPLDGVGKHTGMCLLRPENALTQDEIGRNTLPLDTRHSSHHQSSAIKIRVLGSLLA
jgi:hypothetical protein